MHTCVRCGREATSLTEIHNGCPCGAKVFVFNKDTAKDDAAPADAPAGQQKLEQPAGTAVSNEPQAGEIVFPSQGGAAGAPEGTAGSDGKAPESNFARTTFSTEDVENIKIVSEGVFFVNVNELSKNPVVLKDEEGVYYVRLPMSNPDFDEGSGKGNGKAEGNGKGGATGEGAKKVVAKEKETKD